MMSNIILGRCPIRSGMTKSLMSGMTKSLMSGMTKFLMSGMTKVFLTVIAGLTGNLLTSCTGMFEEINRNPNEVTDTQLQVMNYKTGTNIKTLQSLVVPVQEHLYQFVESLAGCPFGGYIGATPDAWLTKFETFNPSADWRKAPFVDVISQTYPAYRAIVSGTDDEMTVAFARLFRVAIMHRVTDSYGPIPYTQVVGNAEESLTVGYDSQEDVYNAMFTELDEVIDVFSANLGLNASAFSSFDAVYYGNVGQWLKYANSLKLRMAMRLSYVNPDLSRIKAAEAIASGVITANADNAYMHPAENRMTLIYNDWSDHRVGADIICYMNGYEDPRREKMFLLSGNGEYRGIRIGTDPPSKSQAISYFSNMIVESDTPILWMNAAEVSFLMAEYELRWGSEAAARQLYEDGIRLSFEERGATGDDIYIYDDESMPAKHDDPFFSDYDTTAPQSTITVAWRNGADLEENLERIITQKWIAIFPLGTEAWSEYRRTGYPRLMPVVENKSGGTVDVRYGARRLQYPVEEYTENTANLEAAVLMLAEESVFSNGDTMGSRVWWDCKPW